jgi:hypothetical protein
VRYRIGSTRILLLGVILSLLVGCGGSTTSTEAKTAAQVVEAMKSYNVGIAASYVLSADTDPDHLLGTPGYYTSKTTFGDISIWRGVQGPGLTEDSGGSVEIFSSAETAQVQFNEQARRFAQYPLAYNPMAVGNALLLLSRELSDKQVKTYQDAFQRALG